MFDIVAGVFGGVMLSAACIWGFIQFEKHDYRASWGAYAAFLMPLGFALLVIWGNMLEEQAADATDVSAVSQMSDRELLISLGLDPDRPGGGKISKEDKVYLRSLDLE